MQTETSEKRPDLEDLGAALEVGDDALREFLREVHPADLAEWLVELDREQIEPILAALETEDLRELLRFADDGLRQELLEHLSHPRLVEVVEELPADEVVDLLALTDEARTEQVLRAVDFERAQGLRELASYDAETAGGLMTSDFVAVDEEAHVGDAIKLIRTEEGPGEEEPGVFVVDGAGRPLGFVSDRELLTTSIHTPVAEVMDRDLITVNVDDDQEEVAQLVRKYSFPAVPVVDGAGALIGVISAEDAQDVLHEEAEEDILRLIGTSPEEQQTRLPILARVRHRLPLQALTVVGGLVTAWILDQALPDGMGGRMADVLRYLPIIIGLAGNVGIQSSTILVRAFATGEISEEREASVVASEVLVGFLIGIICGVVTMGVAGAMESTMPEPMQFAGAVGGAIAVAVTWAAFLGCIVPMLCQRFGIDPAIVAGPFLITLSDVSGSAIFVGVASLTLGLGGS